MAQNNENTSLASDTLNKDSVLENAGYGYNAPISTTGSAIVIKDEGFNKGFVVSPAELINGKIPGLLFTLKDAYPGADYNITSLRNSTFYFSKAPLVVVDDVLLPGTAIALNPDDIESITFLREGSEAGIYGSRASSGVIMVKTKKSNGDFRVNYTGRMALSEAQKKYEVFSADEFRSVINDVFDEQPDITSLLGTEDTDWQDEIYRTAFSMSHHLSLAGAAMKIPFRVAVGKTLRQGIIKTSGMNRSSGSVAVNPRLFDNHLKIDFNLNTICDNNPVADSNVVRYAVLFDPTKPVRSGTEVNGGYTGDYWNPNPVGVLNLSDFRTKMESWITNIKIDYSLHFLPDMHVVFNYGLSDYNIEKTNITDTAALWVYGGNGRLVRDNLTRGSKNLDLYLSYSRYIEALSSTIELLAGTSKTSIKTDTYNLIQSLTGVVYNQEKYWEEVASESYFARMHFSLRNKYMITLNLRDDFDSRYAPENNQSLFPSVSLKWDLSNERFLSDSKFFQELTFYAGYGIKGLSPTETSEYSVAQEQKSYLTLGSEFSVFGGRLNGRIGFYNNIDRDLIVKLNLPPGTGWLQYMLVNLGHVRNQGAEINLDAFPVINRSVKWRVSYSASLQKTRVIDLGYNVSSLSAGEIFSGHIQEQRPGYPLNSFFVFEQAYDHDGMPIEGEFVDRDHNGTINNLDRYFCNTSDPVALFGVSSSLTYKNWEFAFSGRASVGNYAYNMENFRSKYYNMTNYSSSDLLNNMPTYVLKSGFYLPYNSESDYYIENASFFKMDYISLAYRFKNLFGSKAAGKISAVLQNAFIVTGYSGQDPEVISGISDFTYPRARTGVIEISLDF